MTPSLDDLIDQWAEEYGLSVAKHFFERMPAFTVSGEPRVFDGKPDWRTKAAYQAGARKAAEWMGAEIDQLRASRDELQTWLDRVKQENEKLNQELLLAKSQLQFTNSGWPHEKKLHEKISQLETGTEKLNQELAALRASLSFYAQGDSFEEITGSTDWDEIGFHGARARSALKEKK